MTPDTLLIDGECAFCIRCARWARRWVRPTADLVPFQSYDVQAAGVTVEQCQSAVQWVHADRVTAQGAAAIMELLRTGREPWPIVARIGSLPVVDRLAESVYVRVARGRSRLPGGCSPELASPAS